MQIASMKFYAEQSLLRVAVEGTFSLAQAEAQFADVIRRVVEHRAQRVLFDGRPVTGDPRIMHRFLYGVFVADAVDRLGEKGLSPPPQFAYVLTEPVLDPARFGETVAVNRGVNLKAFDNLAEAERWLGVMTPDVARSPSP